MLGLSKTQIALIVLAVVSILYIMNVQPVFGKSVIWMDEGLYAGVAKNLANDGQFFIATVNPNYASPALSFVGAIAYSFFGVSNFVMYGVVVFFGLLNVAMVFLLGRRMFSTAVGAVAALLAAYSFLFLFFSTRILTDMPLMLYTSVVLFLTHMALDEKKWNAVWPLAIAIAAGLFMKFTFPAFAVVLALVYGIAHRSEWKEWKPLALAAVAVAVLILPIFIYNFTSTGSPIGLIYDAYFRSTFEFGSQAGTGFLWYFENLASILGPPGPTLNWFMLALTVLAVPLAWFNKDNRALMLFAIFVGALLVNSFTGYKENRYILHLFPLAFLLASYTIVDSFRRAYAKSKNLGGLLHEGGEQSSEAAGAVAAFALAAFCAFALFTNTVQAVPFAHQVILSQSQSYGALPPVGAYLQNITEKNEIVISNSGHELAFYANRRIEWISADLPTFLNDVKRTNARYVVLTVYEYRNEVAVAFQKYEAGQGFIANPSNAFEYLMGSGQFEIVQVFYENIQGQQVPGALVLKKK